MDILREALKLAMVLFAVVSVVMAEFAGSMWLSFLIFGNTPAGFLLMLPFTMATVGASAYVILAATQ